MGQTCCTETADMNAYDNTQKRIPSLRTSHHNIPTTMPAAKIPMLGSIV